MVIGYVGVDAGWIPAFRRIAAFGVRFGGYY